ncbi:unnamed protein product [Haemonchus placei]|uniref:Ig-like domain-containing protein n=1 Tax=Haemonchus placei TaxID=6290 RepID=A0A0N4X962_HAEPC|nr:unnamed protein product [Haemonchus placei]
MVQNDASSFEMKQSNGCNTNEADSQKLVLQYAPRINLSLASTHRLREGGMALLACAVDAKPIDDIRISWFKNGNLPLPQTTDTLVLESLKMEDHRSEYTCQASNAIGTSQASLKMDVSSEEDAMVRGSFGAVQGILHRLRLMVNLSVSG